MNGSWEKSGDDAQDTPDLRYEALAQFGRPAELEDEAAWVDRRLETIRHGAGTDWFVGWTTAAPNGIAAKRHKRRKKSGFLSLLRLFAAIRIVSYPANSCVTDRSFAMTPIHELLNRIRWDPDFGRGTFQLGYFDRVEGRVMVVPFREVDFPENDPQVFRLIDTEGRTHRVPFHRVRDVYKDGQRIWHRSPAAK